MLLRRAKKGYFQNLNVKYLSDKKVSWKTIKLYFTNKGLNSNKMLLKEKGELVSDKKQLVSIMNKFSNSIRKSLKLKEDGGSQFVTLNDILKNLFITRLSIRLEKLLKTINSFLCKK